MAYLKATRIAILNLIKADTSLTFKTYLTGYPAMITQEMCKAVAVFSIAEDCEWKTLGPHGSGATNESLFHVGIEIYIPAVNEIYSYDRGESNEDWLNDTAEAIRDLIFGSEIVNTISSKPTRIEYRIQEGNIRVSTIMVEIKKRYER